jgi:hypothetical protein
MGVRKFIGVVFKYARVDHYMFGSCGGWRLGGELMFWQSIWLVPMGSTVLCYELCERQVLRKVMKILVLEEHVFAFLDGKEGII